VPSDACADVAVALADPDADLDLEALLEAEGTLSLLPFSQHNNRFLGQAPKERSFRAPRKCSCLG